MMDDLKDCLGCDAVGLPEPGYGFYLCDKCLDKLADNLEKFCVGGPGIGEDYDVVD